MGSPVAPLGFVLFSQRILYTCRPAGAKDTFENTHAAGEILRRTRSGQCQQAFIPGEVHTDFIPGECFIAFIPLILILIHAMCILNLANL